MKKHLTKMMIMSDLRVREDAMVEREQDAAKEKSVVPERDYVSKVSGETAEAVLYLLCMLCRISRRCWTP